MKEKVEELSDVCLKAFAIGAGDKKGLTEGSISVGDRTAADLYQFVAQE